MISLLLPISNFGGPAGACSVLTGTDCTTGLPAVSASNSELGQILQIVFAVVGALAVLFVVIAGLRFVVAQGDPQDVARARSTIIYALVGLMVALAAEAIVSLVLGKL